MITQNDLLGQLDTVMEHAAKMALEGKPEESNRLLVVANNIMLQFLLGALVGIVGLPEHSKELVN